MQRAIFVTHSGKDTLLLVGACGIVSGYECERNTFVFGRLVKLGVMFHVARHPFFLIVYLTL